MNYGDYAYIEYFPRGMFLTQPDANNARSQQIFQVWIRPVRPEQAHFAVRTALYELGQLIANGMRPEDFEATRKFLLKNVNILTSSQDRQLGYALDSKFYGTGEFTTHMQKQLQELTLDDVNRVLRKYLQDKNIKFVFITRDADDLKKRLVENTVSPISYDAQKPAEILDEDKILSEYPLNFKADKIRIVPVEEVFVH
jgi:zinc protease